MNRQNENTAWVWRMFWYKSSERAVIPKVMYLRTLGRGRNSCWTNYVCITQETLYGTSITAEKKKWKEILNLSQVQEQISRNLLLVMYLVQHDSN